MDTQSPEKNTAALTAPTAHSIEPKFLAKLMVSMLVIFGLSTIVSGIMLYVLTYDPEVDSYLDLVRNMSHTNQVLLRVTLISMFLQLCIVILLMGGVTLLASHQIAGPIIRYKYYIQRLSEGDFPETATFRDRDQDRSLITAFEEVSGRLRGRLEAPRKARQILEEVQRDLSEDVQDVSLEGVSREHAVKRVLEAAQLVYSSGRDFSPKDTK